MTLSDPDNPLMVATLTITRTVAGRTTTTVYDAASDTIDITSPGGRHRLLTLEAHGYVEAVWVP